jgi:hypothetical protein
VLSSLLGVLTGSTALMDRMQDARQRVKLRVGQAFR